MNLVRKGFVHLLAIVLFFSLLGIVATYAFNTSYGTPQKVEKLLSDSHVYDNLVSSSLEQSEDENQQNGGDSSISLSDPIVKKAAGQTFSPQLIEQNVHKFLEANYAWLNGQTDKPQFDIDLSGTKQDFATLVGNYVTNRLKGLPVCTPAQQAQLQIPVDSFNIDCRPKALNPVTEGSRVRQGILDGEFLENSKLTADNLGKDKKSQEKPYYQQLDNAPTLFQLIKKAPFILAGLALLSAAGIIFIHPRRRIGWRRVGIVLAEAGIVLIVIKLLGDTIVNRVKNATLQDASARHFRDQWSELLHNAQAATTRYHLVFGIIFLALAIAIFIYLYKTRGGKTPPARLAPIDTTPETPVADEPAPVPTPVGDVQDRLRQPKPTGPPALGPNPPKKKPPRLIQ